MLGQETFSRKQAVAIAEGLASILVPFGPKTAAGTFGWPQLLGTLGIITGLLCYSLGSVLARPLMRTLPPAEIAATTNSIGGLIPLIGALIFEPGSLAATVIYFKLVHDWGASRTSTTFVSPIVAVLVAIPRLGEHVSGNGRGWHLPHAIYRRPGVETVGEASHGIVSPLYSCPLGV